MNGLTDTKNDFAFELAELNYLYPITNERESFTKCVQCKNNIYYSEHYYSIEGNNYCEDCMKYLFLRFADD